MAISEALDVITVELNIKSLDEKFKQEVSVVVVKQMAGGMEVII